MKRIILLKLLLISATLCFSQSELPQSDSTYWLPEKYVEDLLMNKNSSVKDKKYGKPFASLFTHRGSLYVNTYRGKFGKVNVERRHDTLILKDYEHLINLMYTPGDEYRDVIFLIKPSVDAMIIVQRRGNVDIDSTRYTVPLEEYKSEAPYKTQTRLLLSGKFHTLTNAGQREVITFHSNGTIDSEKWKRYRVLSNTGLVKNAPVDGRAWYRIEIEDVKGNRIKHILFVNDKSGFEIYPTKTDERNRHFLKMSNRVMLTPIKNVPK